MFVDIKIEGGGAGVGKATATKKNNFSDSLSFQSIKIIEQQIVVKIVPYEWSRPPYYKCVNHTKHRFQILL